jgi:RNA polymerase sigma-70 factor (ECF subfamily)
VTSIEGQDFDAELEVCSARLRAAADRQALSRELDELAALAKNHEPALQVLLAAIVEQNLADVTLRKVFFDDQLIDDGVQETVLAVAGGIHGFRGDASFLTWLDRVALNVARQIRRRGNRLSEPVSNDVPELEAWALRVSSIVADEVAVAAAFARLNREHQEVIQLREMEDLSYDQIADRLGLAAGTVRSRLSRARGELTNLLVDLQRGR